MTEHGQNLTLTDIAKLTEVGVSAVSNWRKRHTDFPRSALVSGQELFSADEIAHWLSERKIARNGLHPGEGLGTTYGDRFVRNSEDLLRTFRLSPRTSTQRSLPTGRTSYGKSWTCCAATLSPCLRSTSSWPCCISGQRARSSGTRLRSSALGMP